MLAAAAALAISGCAAVEVGPEKTPAVEEARGTVESFLAACAEEESAPATEALTEATRAHFLASDTIEGCKRVLRIAAPFRPPVAAAEAFREAHVSHVHVEGGFGTAAVTVEEHHSQVHLEEVGGRWKVSNHPLE